MLHIKRSCSYRIITRAVQFDGEPLVALLQPGVADCEPCLDRDQLLARLAESPSAILVYNQQAEAISIIDQLVLVPGQIYIEIRQDTKGVLGLHAQRKQAQGSETLELIYQ